MTMKNFSTGAFAAGLIGIAGILVRVPFHRQPAIGGFQRGIIGATLHSLPPLLFATLRFAAVVFPLIFFVRRPAVSWRILAGYGVAIGVGQFGLLFIAINGYIAAGLASLIVQSQVVFTIAWSLAMLTVTPSRRPFRASRAWAIRAASITALRPARTRSISASIWPGSMK